MLKERAQLLRRFFHDLQQKAGFKTDPRSPGDRHVKAVVAIWQQEKYAPATLSFLRGLAQWIDNPGLIRPPRHYGLRPEEYQRHQAAERDKSWSGNGIDTDPLIASICEYAPYIGAALILMAVLGLRKKEAGVARRSLVRWPDNGTMGARGVRARKKGRHSPSLA